MRFPLSCWDDLHQYSPCGCSKVFFFEKTLVRAGISERIKANKKSNGNSIQFHVLSMRKPFSNFQVCLSRVSDRIPDEKPSHTLATRWAPVTSYKICMIYCEVTRGHWKLMENRLKLMEKTLEPVKYHKSSR